MEYGNRVTCVHTKKIDIGLQRLSLIQEGNSLKVDDDPLPAALQSAKGEKS